MVAKIKLLQAFDARRSDLMAVLGNDTVCASVTVLRLVLQQSKERAWPTPIMDLTNPAILGFLAGFGSRFFGTKRE